MRSIFPSLRLWFLVMFAALGLAYWASLPDVNTGGKVPTQSLPRGAISKVEMRLKDILITADNVSDPERRWWIKTEFQGSTEGSSVGERQQNVKFLASERFGDYVIQLEKFPAQRDLGLIDQVRLKEFGLADSINYLRLKDADDKILAEFVIGRQPYGARSYYVARTSDKKVLLVGSDSIDDLAKPEARFFERTVSKIALSDAKKAIFLKPGKEKSFIRIVQDGNGVSQWADEIAPGQAIPSVSSWLEKFGELRAASYAESDLMEALKSQPVVLEMALVDGKGRSERFEVRSISRNGQMEFYLNTGYLAWPVKIASARAENLLKDLPQILQN